MRLKFAINVGLLIDFRSFMRSRVIACDKKSRDALSRLMILWHSLGSPVKFWLVT